MMLKAIKRLVLSGLKPHTCKLCSVCYICHECMREKSQIRRCCIGITEEEIDAVHEELKTNFSILYPVKQSDNRIGCISRYNEENESPHCCTESGRLNSFDCKICGKTFKADFTLDRHFKSHAKIGEKFKCETCIKCFTNSRDLRRHMLTHRPEDSKSRICVFCDKELSSVSYLKIHLRRHTGERPFSCKLCRSSFTTKSILNIHYRTHGIRNKAADHGSVIHHQTLLNLTDSDNDTSDDDCLPDEYKSTGDICNQPPILSQNTSLISISSDKWDDSQDSSINAKLNKHNYYKNSNVAEKNQTYKAPLVIKLSPL